MASRAGIPETASQLPTSVLRTPVWLNDDYIHKQLKTVSCMPLDGINHQTVSVAAQLPVLACLCQSLGGMVYRKSAKYSTVALRQAFLSFLQAPSTSSVSITHLIFLPAHSPDRCSCSSCVMCMNPLINHQ